MSLAVRILIIALSLQASALYSQEFLVDRMRQHENSILRTYLEYQKLYYEDKSRAHELRAFENLLTVYINQVMEIYETLNLSAKKSSVPRDIAARALVFKSLMYLEKAPLNIEYYERACYEYYEALSLYEGTDEPPVIYKDLPQPIQAGDKTYYRLKELIDDKGTGLQKFGKVNLMFRDFMVTANFDPELLTLSRIEGEKTEPTEITYQLAESRIKKAFSEVFKRTPEVETYVALPQGTYVLKLLGRQKTTFTPLTRLYVRPNQEHSYILEPIADWVILYENPTSQRPDYYKFSRNQDDSLAAGGNAHAFETNGNSASKKSNKKSAEFLTQKHEQLVADIVSAHLPNFEIKMMFDLNDPEIRRNAVEIISRSIVKYVESRAFFNKWNQWTASWEICRKIREIISPGSLIPIELVELVYTVLNEL